MKKAQIMRYSGILILVAFSIISSACRTKKDSSDTNTKKEFIGEYRSVKGVKDKLSCYCYNAGYLSLEDGSVISICFQNNEESINCKKIRISGKLEIYESASEVSSPCPFGNEKILTVSKYECLD